MVKLATAYSGMSVCLSMTETRMKIIQCYKPSL